MNIEFGSNEFPSINIEINKNPILDGVTNGIINIEESLRVALLSASIDVSRINEMVAIIIYDGELYKIIPTKNIIMKKTNDIKQSKKVTRHSKISLDGLIGTASLMITNSINNNDNISGDVVIAINKSLRIYIGYLTYIELIDENIINIE